MDSTYWICECDRVGTITVQGSDFNSDDLSPWPDDNNNNPDNGGNDTTKTKGEGSSDDKYLSAVVMTCSFSGLYMILLPLVFILN